jgi:hypothetical protein
MAVARGRPPDVGKRSTTDSYLYLINKDPDRSWGDRSWGAHG